MAITRSTINRWLCRFFRHESAGESWIEGDKIWTYCKWCYKRYKLFKVKEKLGPLSFTEIPSNDRQ